MWLAWYWGQSSRVTMSCVYAIEVPPSSVTAETVISRKRRSGITEMGSFELFSTSSVAVPSTRSFS